MNTSQEGVRRWDAIFRTFAAVPRRQIVDSLLHAPADQALDLPGAANPPEDPVDSRRLRVTLRHNHLPLMERHGFVEWETIPFRVWRGDFFEDVEAAMVAIQSHHEYPARLREGCHRLPDAGAPP